MPAQDDGAPQARNALSTSSGRQVLRLFDDRTKPRPWRLGNQAFPIIVLEGETPDAAVDAYVDELERAAADAGIPHIVPVPATGSSERPEIALLDAMINESAWNGLRRGFGRFRFPRSELVRSFEQAIRRAGEKNAERPGSTTPLAEWNESVVLIRWSLRTPVWWSTVIILVAAILGGIAQALASRVQPSALLLTCLALLVVVCLAAGLTTRAIWLPVLSRLGPGTRYRWFATSSFFAVLGGQGFEDRLKRVLERPASERSAEFRLQIRTLAFLEDLRAAHRKLSPGLRGLKRPVPPVVFLKGVTATNGGVELLSAMSDIRSRRSELHPLLVVASAGYDHRGALNDIAAAPDAPASRTIEDLYTAWETSLGTTQAPSQKVAGPWVLRVPIPEQSPDPYPPAPLGRRHRPRWSWLWSWWSLLAALAVAAVGGSYLQASLSSAHCSVRFPFEANVDTVLRTDATGSRECVGVSTRGVRFERGGRSIGLDGNLRAPGPGHAGGGVTLADLQDLIDQENAGVARGHAPYVTILYAGMMTSADGQEQSAVSSVRELAGAYLAQHANNHPDQPGGYASALKIRLLAVNTGQNMDFSGIAVDRVLAMARRDPTVVGVVGMGRNTKASHDAIMRLDAAGLAVVDTVNSSDELPGLPHFYGLAATDHDEADVAADEIRHLRRTDRMLIVSPAPAPTREYGSELADDVASDVGSARSERLVYGPGDIADRVREACLRTPYRLVYYAGRAEDLNGLMTGLSNGGCLDHPLTLFGGDEISRANFGFDPHQVGLAKNLTVYYTTFNYLPNLIGDGRDRDNPFFTLAKNTLGIDPARYTLLADGQMALAYDATDALYEAARNTFTTLRLTGHDAEHAAGSRSVTSGSVLLALPGVTVPKGATGKIVFSPEHRTNGPGDRGLTLVKVTQQTAGRPDYEPVCGRMNGGQEAAGLPVCRGMPKARP